MDNLFVKMLDRRGRLLWISDQIDPSLWDKPLLDYAHQEDRAIAEENFSRCVLKGESVGFASRWYCPISESTVWCWTRIHALEPKVPTTVAAVMVQSVLPDNWDQFTDSDKELLRLLADDHNIKDVATTVDRSESAIDARIRGLKTKLGKHTLHGLVAAASRARLIPLLPPEFAESLAKLATRRAASSPAA